MDADSAPVTTASEQCTRILDRIAETVVADRSFLQGVLAGSLARGHILIEDVPGTGKTLTARTFARALGLEFSRVQFTPDMLPADITGSHVFNEQTGEFEFNPGPLFANVVLADEINRAPPKTQAALLEAMEERQVTVAGETHNLPEPFFVIATQNPIEQEGTFELPEAQQDRFILKTNMGYPDHAGERTLLDRRTDREASMPTITPVIDGDTFYDLQQVPERIAVDGRLKDYIITISRQTRKHDAVEVGVSPRGVQQFLELVRARATILGRKYVIPDDIKTVAPGVLAHRLILAPTASVDGITKREIINDVLNRVEVPAVTPDSVADSDTD